MPSLSSASWSVAPLPDWWVDHAWSEEAPVQPDDHCIDLLRDTQVMVGERHRCSRTATRLLTREAVMHLSQLQVEWDPATERLLLHTASIWRGGERRECLEEARVMVRQQESEQCHGILTGRLSALLLMEDVRPGDVVDFAFSIVEILTLESAEFDLLLSPASSRATGAWYLRVMSEPKARVQWRAMGCDFTPEVEEAGGLQILSWSQKAMPALDPEPEAPPWSWPVPMLQVSGWSDWGQVARCLHLAWERGRTQAPAVQARAARIAEEHAELEDRVTAAIEFVQSDVRYLGLMMGLNKMVPTPPEIVIQRLYGDCKDKSMLLCALLEALGVKARPVLVNTRWLRGTGDLLPALHAFDHAIAVIEWEGRSVFIDGTMMGQGGRIHDRHAGIFEKGLIISADAVALTDLPPDPVNDEPVCFTEDFYLSQSGKRSRIDWTLSGSGTAADSLRNTVRAQGASGFAMNELRAVQGSFPHARRNGVEEIEDNERANQFLIRGSYFMYDWGHRMSRHWNTLGINGRWAVRSALVPPTDRKRTLPLKLPHPSHFKHIVRLHVKKFSGLRAEKQRRACRWFDYTVELTYRTGEVTIEFTWKSLLGEVPAAEFLNYVKEVSEAMKLTGLNLTFPWFGPFHVEVPAAGEEPTRDDNATSGPAPPLIPRFPRPQAADEELFQIPDAQVASTGADSAAAPGAALPAHRTEASKTPRRALKMPSIRRRVPLINLLWLIPAGVIAAFIIIGVNQPKEDPIITAQNAADERARRDPRWAAAEKALTTGNAALAEKMLGELETAVPGTPSVASKRASAARVLGDSAAEDAFSAEAISRGKYHYLAMTCRLDYSMKDPARDAATVLLAQSMHEIWPDSGIPLFVSGRLMLRQGRWLEAADKFKSGLQRDPDNVNAAEEFIESMRAAATPSGTVPAIKEILQAKPQAIHLRVVLIRHLLDGGQKEEALEQIGAAEAFSTKHPLFEVMRAETGIGGSSHAQAVEAIIRLANSNATDMAVLTEAARALYAAGRLKDVVALVAKLGQNGALNNAAAGSLAAEVALKTSTPADAIVLAESVLKGFPFCGRAWQVVANASDLLGKTERAAEARRKAEALRWK